MDEVWIPQWPAHELIKMWRCRPVADAPVREWVAWIEPQAALWDEIAATNATLAPNARFVADHLRGLTKDLQERYTLSQPWSGQASW